MIDTKELRRLAQAASPGPWWVNQDGLNHGFERGVAEINSKEWHALAGAWTINGAKHSEEGAANAEFIAAANPATVIELLDRIEAAEKDVALKERVIDALGSELNAVANERDDLLARIREMERQEPFDADSDAFRIAFEAALKAGNWPATRQGDGYRSPSTQIAWRIAFSTVNRLTLYLAPGAKGE